MFRKSLIVIASGMLGLVASVHAIETFPTQAPPTMSVHQVAWFGPYASEKVAYDAGNRIIQGLNAGFLVVHQPVDPVGRGRGPGWYVIVNYYN